MKDAAKAPQQRVVIGLALVGVMGLYVYYTYALNPLMKRLSGLGQELQQSRLQLRIIEQVIAQGPQLTQELHQLEEDVKRLRRTLPSLDAMPVVIERLSDLARQTGVKIQTIMPDRAVEAAPSETAAPHTTAPKAPEWYRGVPIQIEAVAGFYQVENFLSRVESDDQPMQLQSLRISENPDELRRHQIKLVLIGYFSTEPS